MAAYGNNNRQPNIQTDRFGNPFQLKLAKQVINRKTGEEVNAHKCFVELGGKLYEISICEANATDKREGGLWVKITKKEAQKKQTNM